MLYLGAWWFRFAPLNTFWGLALSALWVLVRTGTYTRAFVLTHDTTHDALFNTRWKNWWTGIFTGLCIAMDASGEQLAQQQQQQQQQHSKVCTGCTRYVR
jgi:fatty acid desaturase